MNEDRAAKATDKFLNKIETQAQWDEHVGNFVRDFGDIFIKYQISLDAGIVLWQLNMVKNRIIEVEDKLDEVIEALQEK